MPHRRRAARRQALRSLPPLTALTALLALSACAGDKAEEAAGAARWLIPSQDLGAPVIDDVQDAVFADGEAAHFAAAQVVPGLDWGAPAFELPDSLWALAQGEQIADIGSCPFSDRTDTGERWSSDCRSRGGYEWRGGLETSEETVGGLVLRRIDYDLHIEADVASPSFAALHIEGAVVFAYPTEGGELKDGGQANVRVSLEGLWAQQRADDPRESGWSDWAALGRWERQATGLELEGHGRVGGIGGFGVAASGLGLDTGCPGMPDGRIALNGVQALTLDFDASGACGSCAALHIDGAPAGEACAPLP
jgi:hypothetical protein